MRLRTALAVACLSACLPNTLAAQDREARLAAVVKEGGANVRGYPTWTSFGPSNVGSVICMRVAPSPTRATRVRT